MLKNGITDTERLNWYEKNVGYIRYLGGVSMDGSLPCWTIRGCSGVERRKTLRESIDFSIEKSEKLNDTMVIIDELPEYQQKVVKNHV
jgi:hypothetical protein